MKKILDDSMIFLLGREQGEGGGGGRKYGYAVISAVVSVFVLWYVIFLNASLGNLLVGTEDTRKSVGINGRTNGRTEDNIIRPTIMGGGEGMTLDSYIPALTEQWVLNNSDSLGLAIENMSDPNMRASCQIFHDNKASPYYTQLHQWIAELAHYTELVSKFTAISDIRKRLDDPTFTCRSLDLVPGGLPQIFKTSQQISWIHTGSGYVEPLLPPMRHPLFCLHGGSKILNLDYLVHDFAAMCSKITKTSRFVLVDMGASLMFHDAGGANSPAIYLMEIYRKFGFPFDHIYAYEITPTKPDDVFARLPKHLRAAYHWINVGVSSDPESLLNPLNMILESYDTNDFIVVKLDIDTSWIEVPLVKQLLADDRISRLVDQFYFEHHVMQLELANSWLQTMKGSIKESLDMFQSLRKKGVSAHYWV